MADTSGVNPSSQGPNAPENPQQSAPKSGGGGWNPKPLKWMGMQFDEEQTRKLWNIIIQNICNQINADKQKAVDAIKKMNPDNNPDSQ